MVSKLLKTVKKYKEFFYLVIISAFVVVGYLLLIKSAYFDLFFSWTQLHMPLFIALLIFLKMLAVIYPPLPGSVLTLGAIPVVGWFNAYLVDFFGSLLGSSVAFYLARKYGRRLVARIFHDKALEFVKKIKIKKDKELEAVFVLRFFYGNISEAVSYGAGLIKIKFKNFFIGTLFALFLNMPLFYLASSVLESRNIVISGVVLVLAVLLFFKLKNRYFEVN